MSEETDKELEGIEKRLYPRVDARIQVGFQTGDEFATCYTRNISRGGIFIETTTLPDPNASVELLLDLSSLDTGDDEKEIRVLGRVVRLMTINEDGKQIHQVAIQFVDMPPQIQVKLDQLYQKVSL